MATYKQPCVHCGTMIDGDSRLCTVCGSITPFGFACPECMRPILKGQPVCANCGRELYTTCPNCGGVTFVQQQCEQCGAGLMVWCANKRCGALQFFENKTCTACGKKLKARKR